ncbi:hypothetical protein Bca4012_036313 [Brassica carinata]|uniref:Uncharacterized protein n=1 Tax=Brassica carinata TaxID=52824 RepID=A0A8X8BAW1_BRACI|nr:hypothetical protein Bca52824_010040 [Brassica carinata]
MPANRTVISVPSKLSHLGGVPRPHNTIAIKNTDSRTLPPLIAKGLHLLTSPNNHVLLLIRTGQEATTPEKNRHRENRHLHGKLHRQTGTSQQSRQTLRIPRTDLRNRLSASPSLSRASAYNRRATRTLEAS